jgi:hypothetical protein
MGHTITYCVTCGTQVREADFEKRSAFRVGEKVYCAACVPEATPSPKGALPGPETPSRGSIAARVPRTAAPERRAPLPWIVGGLGLGALVVIALVLSTNRPDLPAPARPEAALPPAAPPRSDPAARLEEAAFQSLKRARDFSKANPEDPAGKIGKYEEAVRDSQGTSFLKDATRELQLLQGAEGERRAAELALLDGPVTAARAREDFGEAIERLETARKQRAEPGWTTAIDRKIREMQDSARALLQSVQAGALEARRQGNEEEVKRLRDRVERWRLPALRTGLETVLAGAPPPAPPAPAVRSYDLRWKKALALAAGRDPAAAIRELEEPARSDPDGAADLERLRQAAAFHAATLKAILGWPKGEKLSLKVRDEEGKIRTIEGSVFRADERRIELKQEGGTVAVEVGEIAPESFVRIDARGAVLASLIERDLEGALRCQADPPSAIPEKYWLHAREPGTDPRESEARKLFHGALRDFQDPQARAECARKCRLLLADFAETAVVRRNQGSLLQRCEAGKDYFLTAADLAAGGSFKASSSPKVGPCWTSTEDVDAARARENHVEFVFAALPETEYRCWVLVGGCCAETFAFHYQATDLTTPHPRDAKQAVPAEPGGNFAAPARHEILYLKASHTAHGGPKESKRWEWVALRLPKYAAAGPKRVRLLSDQKGYSVAAVVVSSLRKGPPLEAELKEELEHAGPRLAEKGARASPPPQGKAVFSENFDRGPGKFNGGEMSDEGAGGSKAIAIPPKGISASGAFSTTVGPSTTVRLKLKPLCDVSEVQIMVWSVKRNDNYRVHVTGLKKGEWKDVEFKALEWRIGWARDGPSIEGDLLDNLMIHFKGPDDGRMLLDDLEIRE